MVHADETTEALPQPLTHKMPWDNGFGTPSRLGAQQQATLAFDVLKKRHFSLGHSTSTSHRHSAYADQDTDLARHSAIALDIDMESTQV